MKLVVLLIIILIPFVFILKAFSTEVIINPYAGIDYYTQDCECDCEESQPYFDY